MGLCCSFVYIFIIIFRNSSTKLERDHGIFPLSRIVLASQWQTDASSPYHPEQRTLLPSWQAEMMTTLARSPASSCKSKIVWNVAQLPAVKLLVLFLRCFCMWFGQRTLNDVTTTAFTLFVTFAAVECGSNCGGSDSTIALSSWRRGVHYSKVYILFAQRTAMHHTDQCTSSPLMRTVQPEKRTTPSAHTRMPAIVILEGFDQRFPEIPPHFSISPPWETAPRANAGATCFCFVFVAAVSRLHFYFSGGDMWPPCDTTTACQHQKKTQLESRLWWWDLIAPWHKRRGCLEAEDSIRECTGAVSSDADWLPSIILHQKALFTADICGKIRKRCAAFKPEDTVEYRQARYQLPISTGAAKRTCSRRLESCCGGTTESCGGGSSQLPTTGRM